MDEDLKMLIDDNYALNNDLKIKMNYENRLFLKKNLTDNVAYFLFSYYESKIFISKANYYYKKYLNNNIKYNSFHPNLDYLKYYKNALNCYCFSENHVLLYVENDKLFGNKMYNYINFKYGYYSQFYRCEFNVLFIKIKYSYI